MYEFEKSEKEVEKEKIKVKGDLNMVHDEAEKVEGK